MGAGSLCCGHLKAFDGGCFALSHDSYHMPEKEDPVKYWLGVRQCIADINKATASLELALACKGEPDDFISVRLTKRQIAMLLTLLQGVLA